MQTVSDVWILLQIVSNAKTVLFQLIVNVNAQQDTTQAWITSNAYHVELDALAAHQELNVTLVNQDIMP